MGSYVLVVFVHIAAAVALLGASVLGEPAVRAAVRRAVTVEEMRAYLRLGRPLSVVSPVAALFILASGAYLSSVGRFWALGWIQVATAFWIVNSIVALVVVKPAVERVAAEAREEGGPVIGARLDGLRWSGAWTRGADLLAANDAAMLFLMTARPGLGGSLAVVLLVNGVVVGTRQVLGVQRPPAPAPIAGPRAT